MEFVTSGQKLFPVIKFAFPPLCLDWKASITSKSLKIEHQIAFKTSRKPLWWRLFRSETHHSGQVYLWHKSTTVRDTFKHCIKCRQKTLAMLCTVDAISSLGRPWWVVLERAPNFAKFSDFIADFYNERKLESTSRLSVVSSFPVCDAVWWRSSCFRY